MGAKAGQPHEASEIFGYPSHSLLSAAKRSREQYHCPFLNSRCIKPSQHRSIPAEIPFGVCSVWHKGRSLTQIKPYIICPVRLTQNNLIFHDARRLMIPKGKHSHYLVLNEIGLKLGRLDYVVAEYDMRAGALLNFLLLEVMAVSTTTTGQVIKSMLDTLLNRHKPTRYNYGINLRQVVSRMMIQVIAKAYATAKWKVPMVWAIQDVLYEFMLSTTKLNLASIDITQDHISTKLPILFFVYEMVTDQTGTMYHLQLDEVKGGTLDNIEEVLIPKTIPSRKEINKVLLTNIRNGKFFDLTKQPTAAAPAPSLAKLVEDNKTE